MIAKTLTCTIAALLFLLQPAAAEQRTIKLGTEGAYPPFNSVTADGKLEGFDIDIGNALCAQIKAKCEWIVQDWDGMIPALQAGKFDAIVASMFITEERRKQVDFTDRYYRTPAAIVVRKDGGIDDIDPAKLAGKSIGVQNSGVYLNYAEAFLRASDIRPYPAVQESFADLANGRLDAVNDDLIVIEAFLATPEGACCRLAGTIVPIPEIHGPGAGIAVRKGDPLGGELNSAIKAIRADDTYKRINDKYFRFDLYGGDR